MRFRFRPAALVALVLLPFLACAKSDRAVPTEGTVRSADGVPIHYRVAGSGAPAIVFVHGWACDGSYWDEPMSRFAADHRVVAVDLAGHGRSGADRSEWTMRAFGGDVVAVLTELDIDDAVLVGHSMGGPVVVEAALAAPNRVRGIVGVDNFQAVDWPITREQTQGFLGGFRGDFPAFTENWVRTMFPESADPALVDRVAKDMASEPPAVGVASLEGLFTWMLGEEKERLASLPVPLHCVNSDQTPTDVEALTALVPGYRLDLMPGRGHFLMLVDPATFDGLLAESIAAFPSGT